MDKLTVDLLKAVSEYVDGGYTGAFNIRENGGCAGRQSTDNIFDRGKKRRQRIGYLHQSRH